jgi:transposase
MHIQTKLRTEYIPFSENKSYPVGTILAVQGVFDRLGLSEVFKKHKRRGICLASLVEAMVSYKLVENFSISKASIWVNQKEMLETFRLKPFEERTMFRVLEILGENMEEILYDLQRCLFRTFSFEHTDVNLDWTSLVLYGDKCKLGKYGYSRDHRPDKRQLTLGLAELAHPINIPIGLTVNRGNVCDVRHFTDTYQQIRPWLREGSTVVFDKGAHSKENIDLILADKMKYLTSKKLNTSDDLRIKEFSKCRAELVDPEDRVYGIRYVKPSSIDYFFYSETLKKQQLEARKRVSLRKLHEAQEIQSCLDHKRGLPLRFQLRNVLVDVKYFVQTRLHKMSEKEALECLYLDAVNGREGFFCIKSCENLTLREALETYRKKDSIEKLIHSLKNEIEIKPVRVWTENSVYGALLIGFLSQLVVSLLRYMYAELKHTCTKFIKKSLMNLTVTVEKTKNKVTRLIYSNFDPLNKVIIKQNTTIT